MKNFKKILLTILVLFSHAVSCTASKRYNNDRRQGRVNSHDHQSNQSRGGYRSRSRGGYRGISYGRREGFRRGGYRGRERRRGRGGYQRRSRERNWTDLHHAASHGCHSKIKELLKRFKVNAETSETKTTPLHLAITGIKSHTYNDHMKTIVALLENGANINAQTKRSVDNRSKAKEDEKKKKTPNQRSTPLDMALGLSLKKFPGTYAKEQLEAKIEFLKLFFNNKNIDLTTTRTMPPNQKNPYIRININPLHTALLSPQPHEMTQFVLQHEKVKAVLPDLINKQMKIIIDGKPCQGSTPLDIALGLSLKKFPGTNAKKQLEEKIEFLKLFFKNKDIDLTAIKTMPTAPKKGHPYIETNVNILHSALLSPQPYEMTQFILQQQKIQKVLPDLINKQMKIIIDGKPYPESTPLDIAITQGLPEIIILFLKKNANPNIQTHGKTKIDKARTQFGKFIRAHKDAPKKDVNPNAYRYSSTEVCELIPPFLEHGAQVDIPNKFNQTPLFWIIKLKLTKELRILIKKSTEKNGIYEALFIENKKRREDLGTTIWQTIEKFYDQEIVKILLETRNKDGITLLEITKEKVKDNEEAHEDDCLEEETKMQTPQKIKEEFEKLRIKQRKQRMSLRLRSVFSSGEFTTFTPTNFDQNNYDDNKKKY